MTDKEKLKFDRRLFLQGLTLSSAGLLVPRKAYSFAPQIVYPEGPFVMVRTDWKGNRVVTYREIAGKPLGEFQGFPDMGRREHLVGSLAMRPGWVNGDFHVSVVQRVTIPGGVFDVAMSVSSGETARLLCKEPP